MIKPVPIQALVLSLDASSTEDGSWQSGILQLSGRQTVRFVATGLRRVPPGSDLDLVGTYETHPVYGEQLRILECQRVTLPTTLKGLELLLQQVPGIGPKYAHAVASTLGFETIARLNNKPAVLRELIPGRKGLAAEYGWKQWTREYEANARAMDFAGRLISAGVNTSSVGKIVTFFRTAEVAEIIIKRHPYRLLTVPGFGWQRTERFARRIGVAKDHDERLEAAVVTAMEEACASGHSCAPEADAVRWATRYTGSSSPAMRGLEVAEASCALIRDGGCLYLPDALEAEWKVASRLRRHMAASHTCPREQRSRVRELVRTANLSDEQAKAVTGTLENGVFALTGGPGTGKTWTLRTVIQSAQLLGLRIEVVAPTGKAAARAKEVTGVDASTIHRLIGGAPGGQRPTPLDLDLVVVDEASMVSLEVFAWLLGNLSPRTRILMVGDPAQLPSIDHGAVLRDVLAANIPSVCLTDPRRQARHSGIVENAGRVMRGDDLLPNRTDFLYADVTDRSELRGGVDGQWEKARARARLTAAVRWLQQQGVDITAGVQVLTPMRRDRLGVESLNVYLQDLVNARGKVGPRIGGGRRVRVGDRVQQVRNDYSLGTTGLFNGEQGVVTHIGADYVIVRLEEREIPISGYRLFNLRLAWAVTVHRSQGSEWHNVIALFHRSHGRMLSRELLYTAITRAKERFVLIGDEQAYKTIQDAAHGQRGVRHTGLARRLTGR